jgi:hypothetical protein
LKQRYNQNKPWKGYQTNKKEETERAAIGKQNQEQKKKGVEYILPGVDQSMTFCNHTKMLMDPNLWIGDTGATIHSTPYDIGGINLRPAGRMDGITVGNGDFVSAQKIVDIVSTVVTNKGVEKETVQMTDVAVHPKSAFNLFSITKMMKQGWKVGNDHPNNMWLAKDGNKLVFDIVIPTNKGMMLCIYLKRHSELGLAVTDEGTKMSIIQAHVKLGHFSEAITRKTAKQLKWTITRGGMEPCEACAKGKARQKNVV